MKKTIEALCFWCGQDTGRTFDIEDEQDRYTENKYILDYEPCKECTDKWNLGSAVVVEVVEDAFPIPPLLEQDGKTYWPTGRHAVVSQEWIESTINSALKDKIMEQKIMFLGPDPFQMLFVGNENGEA